MIVKTLWTAIHVTSNDILYGMHLKFEVHSSQNACKFSLWSEITSFSWIICCIGRRHLQRDKGVNLFICFYP